MKIHTTMPRALKGFYQRELEHYRSAIEKKHYQISWHHLERAHILGQAYPYQHTYIHWKMLCFGIRIKNGKEIMGQIPRLLVGGVKSFVGHIPVGNSGGANVPPLKPMEIPEDLASILNNTRKKSSQDV
jgi:hypothetical protein